MSNFAINLTAFEDIKTVEVMGETMNFIATVTVDNREIQVVSFDGENQVPSTLAARLAVPMTEYGINGDIIIVVDPFMAKMIAERNLPLVYAILGHEAGHIANGDLYRTDVEKAELDGQIIMLNNVDLEIAADNFAIQHVGAREFLSALKETVTHLGYEADADALEIRYENIRSKFAA